MPGADRHDGGIELGDARMKQLLFAVFLAGAPEHLVGDLEEESAAQSLGWLVKQVVVVWLQRVNWLETAAATAFLLGFPLVFVLAIRRYSLAQIPFRESAEFTVGGVVLLAVGVGALTAWLTRLLGGGWLPVGMAAAFTLIITFVTGAPVTLVAAAIFGGSLATSKKGQRYLS